MSLIDWSDPEEMLGLLIEYVDDEAVASGGDAPRAHFLSALSKALVATAEQDLQPVEQIEQALREIHDRQPAEFASDEVISHLEACIEELRRIATVHHRETPAR